ncbi:unnamed protein product [Arctia plantaginis]|uniref:Chemosensory protein n=1 Tax=Arctia plantaginis TaxID=874455 RepID=A0A8S0ZP93_ARCPL|nr:unnamed protein product [Arctia plantaginis]CAB3234960.1 unnamed protein product [Arctia plantaginis]
MVLLWDKLDVLSTAASTIYSAISLRWNHNSQTATGDYCSETKRETMKYLLVLCCIAVAVVAEDKYTDKYDNLDLDEILQNKRLLDAYVNCIMDHGKCTAEGKELKDHLQEAIETGCAKCTENQEKGSYKVIEHLIKNEIKIWRELTAKFDPKGTYRKKYEDRARAAGIEIPE